MQEISISTNKVVGTKQAARELKSDNVNKVYIAKDADTHIVKDIIDLCNEKEVDIIFVDTMKELGEACGIDVNAATVAILK